MSHSGIENKPLCLGRRLSGWGNRQRQTCKACGAPDKFNFHVPNAIWRSVVPKELQNHVVCLGCFDDFANDKDVDYATSLTMMFFTGDQATLTLSVSKIT